MTIKCTCSKCGKEVELEDKWQGFANKYPERILCMKCKKNGAVGEKAKANEEKAKSFKSNAFKSKTSDSFKPTIKPEHFRHYYMKVRETFSQEELEEVLPFLGGWTTTLILQADRTKTLEDV